MNREHLKTLILVFLVIMSIIFTQKIWFYPSARMLNSEASLHEKQLSKIIEIKNQLLIPQEAIVSFGNNNYTVVYDDIEKLWFESKKVLAQYFQGDPDIIPSTYEKYREINRLKSIELKFGKNIPSVLISSIFNTVDNKVVNNIREIKSILIPLLNRGSIYIIGKDNNVFEIKLHNYEENRTLSDYIDNLQTKNPIKYYPLFVDIGNYTVMPLSYNKSIPLIFVESQLNLEKEEEILEKAKSFFNDSFDFVKTIRETSGALVFIYGYGEKGVRINSLGRLEYNQEVGNITSSNVITALEEAIDFVIKHGGFPEGAYLKEIRYEDKKGYFFGFGYRIEGLPVTFSNPNLTYPIEVVVYGDKVKNYRSFVRKGMMLPKVETSSSIKLPQRIIEDNIELLIEDYLTDIQESKELMDKEILNYLGKSISQIELVYFDTMEDVRRQMLKPAWRIKINKRVYYFDSYDGKLLHSSLLN